MVQPNETCVDGARERVGGRVVVQNVTFPSAIVNVGP